ncbi:MAG: PoNe immunity protein domain-containing protein [Candidatus Roizmanbacteria bacterium]
MITRDELFQNPDHFIELIGRIRTAYTTAQGWIKDGKIKSDRIVFLKQGFFYDHLDTMNALYSAGYPIIDMVPEYTQALELMPEVWANGTKKFRMDTKEGLQIYDTYYMDANDSILAMLGLGYLLNITTTDFQCIVDIIDRDKIQNLVYETIIKAKIPSRKVFEKESYNIPNPIYASLRKAIFESDKEVAQKVIKHYLEKEWYQLHKDAGWYNSHKGDGKGYSGYWSFETAAIVKIKGLDDSIFRDNEYYPKDLVHQQR